LTGIRSKDLLSDVPPLAFNPFGDSNTAITTVPFEEEAAAHDLISLKDAKRKKSKDKDGSTHSSRKHKSRDGSADSRKKSKDSTHHGPDKHKHKKDGHGSDTSSGKGKLHRKGSKVSGKGGSKGSSGKDEKSKSPKPKRKSLPLPSLEGSDYYKSKITNLKKRGEPDIPIVEYVGKLYFGSFLRLKIMVTRIFMCLGMVMGRVSWYWFNLNRK